LNDRIYIGVTAVTDRPDTVRSLTRYLSRRTQSSPKNLDELKHQPTPTAPLSAVNWRSGGATGAKILCATEEIP